MFCPGCGEQENNPVQFCRLCGANLGVVRDSLAEADNYTASSISAREEIARAAAEKIKTGKFWEVSAIVPEVEKLFESPQERRQRLQRQDNEKRLVRLRGGVITASVGLGLMLLFLIVSTVDPKFFGLIGPSLLVFIIGLGVAVNGIFFTLHKKHQDNSSLPALPAKSDYELGGNSAESQPARLSNQAPFRHLSVIENTTQNLVEDKKRDTNKITRQKHFNE